METVLIFSEQKSNKQAFTTEVKRVENIGDVRCDLKKVTLHIRDLDLFVSKEEVKAKQP